MLRPFITPSSTHNFYFFFFPFQLANSFLFRPTIYIMIFWSSLTLSRQTTDGYMERLTSNWGSDFFFMHDPLFVLAALFFCFFIICWFFFLVLVIHQWNKKQIKNTSQKNAVEKPAEAETIRALAPLSAEAQASNAHYESRLPQMLLRWKIKSKKKKNNYTLIKKIIDCYVWVFFFYLTRGGPGGGGENSWFELEHEPTIKKIYSFILPQVFETFTFDPEGKNRNRKGTGKEF